MIKILLIEDNPGDARLIKEYLTDLKTIEHTLQIADRLKSGIEILENEFIDVVLLDLKLPKVNGLEVLRSMKNDPHLQTIPVVMVTSSAEHPDVKAAYNLGANGYVIKPVQFDSFMEAMSKVGVYWLMVNHPMK